MSTWTTALAALVLLAAVVLGVRSCRERAAAMPGPPAGSEYVMRCRADGHEFRMSPKEMNEAFARGEVRGSGDGVDLFRCPKCGQLAGEQILKTRE